jgi:hypothetical protein
VVLVVGLGLVGLGLIGCATSSADDGAGAGGSAVSATGGFLADDQVTDLVKIAPGFPFGVKQRHAASGPALDARWGAHRGPVVTTLDHGAQKVTRWTMPDGVTDAATHTDLTSATPTALPAQPFWGVDGFVDLPFDSLTMRAYSSSGDNFPGEVLFFSKDYDRVVARGHVNAFYSGLGVLNGEQKRVVYSGLSGIGTDAQTGNDCALYASDVCDGSPAPTGSCPASVKLFGWQGSSGPVATDADGNVFVAGFVTTSPAGQPATETDTIYAVTKTQSFASDAVAPGKVSERKTGGTASIAAVSAPGSHKGWIIAKGHDDKTAAPSYALPYTVSDTAIAAAGPAVEQAIIGASPDASLSFFTDPEGNLWVAVELPTGSTFLELTPRP